MAVDYGPYSTAKPLFSGSPPQWASAEDQDRIRAYALYEALYRNLPESFKIIQRGSEQNPIYLPSAKKIVEACNRYLLKRWNYVVDTRSGSEQEQKDLSLMLLNLFRREEMYAKVATQKRWGLVRGDVVWHLTADENKPEGKRISIHVRDPGSYFPIFDVVDDTKVVGCHLVDQYETKPGSNKYVLRRQTYRKDPETQLISYEISWWELTGWDDREGSSQTLKPTPPPEGFTGVPAFTLPPIITALPVYHWKNDINTDAPFGTSEIAGIERIIGGMNQGISDEELALVLEGLGVYWTNSGPPVDENNEETTWKIGPGMVLEIDDESEFGRIKGVDSIKPWIDHLEYLERQANEATGTSDMAIGKVTVAEAESGIALLLKMAPTLSKNEEKEVVILSKLDHMLYDLSTMWLPAYEGLPGTAIAVSVVDDPLPVNRKQVVEEIVALVTAGLMSREYAVQQLSQKLGYEFPENMLDTLVAEAAALAKAVNWDPFITRADQELDDQQQA